MPPWRQAYHESFCPGNTNPAATAVCPLRGSDLLILNFYFLLYPAVTVDAGMEQFTKRDFAGATPTAEDATKRTFQVCGAVIIRHGKCQNV
jgi:hypothetical protein